MIHPPDVVGISPDAIIGDGGTGGGGDGAKKKKHKKVGEPVVVDKGDLLAIHQAGGHLDGRDNWREGEMDSNPGFGPINVRAYFYAAWYLLCAGLDDVAVTIFVNNNLKIWRSQGPHPQRDRAGLLRVIHAVGNLRVCKGPGDSSATATSQAPAPDRLWAPRQHHGGGILLSILLHVVTGIKRTRDTSLNLPRMGDKRALDLADMGLILLTFTISLVPVPLW